jgi:hypothetical protein
LAEGGITEQEHRGEARRMQERREGRRVRARSKRSHPERGTRSSLPSRPSPPPGCYLPGIWELSSC